MRLSEVAQTWHPCEVAALIVGLPESSRYYMRMSGENGKYQWNSTDWLLLDIRNTVEALRVMTASQGTKKGGTKPSMREWEYYPGAEAEKQKQIEQKLATWGRFAQAHGGKLTSTM